MAGLAHILVDWKVAVSGTDMAPSAMARALQNRGVPVRFGHAAAAVAGADLLVYSNAVPPDNPERQAAAALGIESCLRGEFLARVGQYFATVVCVGGSHGKTTTTAMIAHILRETGRDPGLLVGGAVTGWERSATAGAGRLLVTEVDESDGTQALMQSSVAVITNIEDDHCWSVGGEAALRRIFAEFAERAARVVTWDAPATREVLGGHPCVRFAATGDIPTDLELAVAGQHNRSNACLALLVTDLLGVPRQTAVTALRTFPGVDRRLSLRFRAARDRRVVVEDYAHHPTELRASLSALRETWPDHLLHVVFQPHRFERVKRYAGQFGAVLSELADEVIVVAPFAAWIDDAGSADPRTIAAAVQGPPCRYWTGALDDLARELSTTAAAAPCVLAVVGAGDVGQIVAPLVRGWLEQEWTRLEQLLAAAALPAERSRTWAELTTLAVGMDRPLLVRPRHRHDLVSTLQLAAAEDIPVWPLGAGSKLVGTDAEPLRLVVSLTAGEFTRIETGDGEVTVGAGVCLSPLIRTLAADGTLAAALAPLAWVPATLGGALRMNAGAQGAAIGDVVVDVHGFHADGSEWHAAGSEIAWHYRHSSIPADVIVTSARLRCGCTPPGEALAAIAAAGTWRRQTQPGGRSAGSVFRNPPGDHAGRLLDAAGCKGLRCGTLRVSEQHANFIVNEAAAASESDLRQLVGLCRGRVREHCGIVLQEELCWCGDAGRATAI
jgi:UDP-N-acetylmuramate--alanine ligase